MSTLTFTSATGSIAFKDRPTTSPFGWFFRDLVDWYTTPDSKSPLNARAQADGDFGVARDWREGAAISATLLYLGVDHNDAVEALSQFSGVIGLGLPVKVTFDDGGVATSRQVSVRNAKPDDTRGGRNVRWVTDLHAPDPLRYGVPVAVATGVPVAGGGLIFPFGSGAALLDFGTGGVSGRIAVTNTGKAPVFPSFDVTGGLGGGFVVTDVTTNQVVRLDRQIPDGSTIFVNQRTGRVYIDNPTNDVSGALSSRDWFQIGPGETHFIQFQPLGAVTGVPTLTVRTPPAYF